MTYDLDNVKMTEEEVQKYLNNLKERAKK